MPNAKRPAALGKPGEQVFGVRFVGDRAYVVTFRTIDPLYVLDLSNPNDPRNIGQLELPGVSDHLLPLQADLMLGFGRDVDTSGRLAGLKVTLFDMRTPAAPREVSSLRFGGLGSSSALDNSPHGLNLQVKNGMARVALPVFLIEPNGPRHGLQRMEIDLGPNPALRERALIEPPPASAPAELWYERSAQVGDRVYYLSQRQLAGYAW